MHLRLGLPQEYRDNLLVLQRGEEIDQRQVLRKLVDMQYDRNDMNLTRGKFRVRGDTIELHPAYDETAIRIELFGDEIERITVVDPLTGEHIRTLDDLAVYGHPLRRGRRAHAEGHRPHRGRAGQRLAWFEQRASCSRPSACACARYDLEMMQESASATASRTTRRPSTAAARQQPPHTLLDFFPDDFLCVIDEGHGRAPAPRPVRGRPQPQGAAHRLRLRLPSAADNRPLRFEEFIERVNQVVFLSATPADYELQVSGQVVEQIVRPTGLVDPEVVVRPTKGQIDDLLTEVHGRIERDQRVLVTTLTKKMAEDLSDLLEQGLRVRYLHSNIGTIERIEILRALRLGEFDVLVINLLQEGLDLPEVSLVTILDADKEGFLRSETSLIQTIGRAARNVDGQVIMYADTVTDSMRRAIGETQKRRQLQLAYNAEHGIEPQTIRKAVNDILAHLRPAEGAPVPGDGRRRGRPSAPSGCATS